VRNELGVLHAKNVHHQHNIIIFLFLFLVVNPNFQNNALIVVRVNAGVRLNIVTVRVFMLCEAIAVPLVFIVLKRMVIILLTLETITI
jgi:hypothetical protein